MSDHHKIRKIKNMINIAVGGGVGYRKVPTPVCPHNLHKHTKQTFTLGSSCLARGAPSSTPSPKQKAALSTLLFLPRPLFYYHFTSISPRFMWGRQRGHTEQDIGRRMH